MVRSNRIRCFGGRTRTVPWESLRSVSGPGVRARYRRRRVSDAQATRGTRAVSQCTDVRAPGRTGEGMHGGWRRRGAPVRHHRLRQRQEDLDMGKRPARTISCIGVQVVRDLLVQLPWTFDNCSYRASTCQIRHLRPPVRKPSSRRAPKPGPAATHHNPSTCRRPLRLRDFRRASHALTPPKAAPAPVGEFDVR